MSFVDKLLGRKPKRSVVSSASSSVVELLPAESDLQRELREEKEKLAIAMTKVQRDSYLRAYEATKPSQYWKNPGDAKSGNAVIDAARAGMRSFARHLDENHDIAVAVLDDLVKKTVGCGIQVTFCVKKPDGSLHEEINKNLAKWFSRWTANTPDTTRTMPWPMIESLVARSFFRDGEMLVQHVMGNAPINHRTKIPYSIELIEADYLPYDLNAPSTSTSNRVVHGIEMNDWKEPMAFWVYKEHPGDVGIAAASMKSIRPDVKRVSADQMSHVKFVRRFDQVRGVSVFHAVMRRLEDIKEYEESERIAARVAAALCAVITKSPDFQGAVFNPNNNQRVMEFNPGMIFDNLNPGEKVEVIGSERPNTNLGTFREDMLRAVAGGTGASFSGIARNYNGSYSSQRQELVEGWVGYEMVRELLYGMFYRPITQRFVSMAMAAGVMDFAGADPETLFDVDFVGPAMPWIDPTKEVEAKAKAVESNFMSRHMVIRENQLDPAIVDEQIEADPLHPKQEPAAPSQSGDQPAPLKPAAKSPAKESTA